MPPRPSDVPGPVEQLALEANGLRFQIASAGPDDGPLVLLLHGFPELSYGWRHQLVALAGAGLRVVAPDQRGYGLSSKPKGVRAYALDHLVADVVALASALGHHRFAVVGHDWGGVVAWHLASRHPEHLERLAILNAPHPGVVAAHALQHPMQLLRSAYVGFFQMPVLPEFALAANDYRLLAHALEGSSRAGAFSPEEMDVYRKAWGQDGALTAMLNWYRAIPLTASATGERRISLPVLIVWGDRDNALEPSLAEASASLCDDVVVTHLPDATHWLHHEEVEVVNGLLSRFLEGMPAPPGTTTGRGRQTRDVASPTE